MTRKSDGIEYALKQVGRSVVADFSNNLSVVSQVKIQKLTEKEKQNALNEVRILASIK